MNYSIQAESAPVRKREIAYLIAFAVLLWVHLDRDTLADERAIAEAKERIELSLETCQRAITAANKHANVLATIFNERESIVTAPGVKTYCRSYKLKETS